MKTVKRYGTHLDCPRPRSQFSVWTSGVLYFCEDCVSVVKEVEPGEGASFHWTLLHDELVFVRSILKRDLERLVRWVNSLLVR